MIYIYIYLLLLRIKLGNMSYYKNRGTTGTNRTLILNDFEPSSHSRQKNWVCLTATVPNIDFQPPKRNKKHQKAMALTTNMNEQKLFAIQGGPTTLRVPWHNDTTNCIVYNRNTKLQVKTCLQFSNSPISMAEPTASNIIQSSLLKHKYIKTSFLWHTQPYQIQIILSLLKQVQPHKAAFAKLASVHDTQPTVSNTKVMHTHRRMCVCVQNIEKIQPVNVSSIRWFSN